MFLHRKEFYSTHLFGGSTVTSSSSRVRNAIVFFSGSQLYRILNRKLIIPDLNRLLLFCRFCSKINFLIPKSEFFDFLKKPHQRSLTTFLKFHFWAEHCLTRGYIISSKKRTGPAQRKDMRRKNWRICCKNFFFRCQFLWRSHVHHEVVKIILKDKFVARQH